MNEKNKTRVDQQLSWIKNNKILSFIIIMGIILISLATFTDSLSKLHDRLSTSEDKDVEATTKSIIEALKDVNVSDNYINKNSVEELKKFEEAEIRKLEKELKDSIERFAGAAEAFEEIPNYSDAMEACSLSRNCMLYLYLYYSHEGQQLTPQFLDKLDMTFQKTIKHLEKHTDIAMSEVIRDSIERRYQGFKLIRTGGLQSITRRMREVWKEL